MLSWDDYDQDGLAGAAVAAQGDAATNRSFLEGLEVAVVPERRPEPPAPRPASGQRPPDRPACPAGTATR